MTMPKRKGGPAATDKADPDQHARFVEAARELECDDDPAAFDRMFERVVPPKRKPEEPAATTGRPPLPNRRPRK